MKQDIVTSHRDDNVRASFHFYNNEDDVESFIAAMQELRGSFAHPAPRIALKTGCPWKFAYCAARKCASCCP